MSYVPTVWEDLPSEDTPINADNLNNIEQGIVNAALQADLETQATVLTAAIGDVAGQAVSGGLEGNMPSPTVNVALLTKVFDMDVNAVAAADTTVETTLGTLVLEEGLVTSGCKLLLSVFGRLRQNDADCTFTYRLKINGTTVWTYDRAVTSESVNFIAFAIDWAILCPTDQAQHIRSLAGFAGGGGVGDAVNGVAFAGSGPVAFSNQTLDMSGENTFTFTVQMSVAGAATSTTLYGIAGELVTPF